MKKILLTSTAMILALSLVFPTFNAWAYLITPDGFLVMKKSKGVTTNDFGKKTYHKVCGSEVCKEEIVNQTEKSLKNEQIKNIKKITASDKAAEFMKVYYRLK
ncbi:MAG: hypothetical protein DWQ18_03365 [Crenarchaeota archaeon]|nr:MAG: hypothetical protein DWQ17_09765 [Thermoproteota archaeon]RDJ33956.1 MAG: hypothetical protein DWQ18_03365 [Thermoproteota archaeon]